MTTGRINQIATSGSVPPVRRGGHARPRRSGGTTRAPTAVLSSFFQMCPFHRTGETFLTTRLPGSTHTKCACRESAPFVLNTPTLLIPHSATLQEQERVSDPGGGITLGPLGTREEDLPRCTSHIAAQAQARGRERVPCALWLQTDKRTGQKDYQCQTLSPSAVDPRRAARSTRFS